MFFKNYFLGKFQVATLTAFDRTKLVFKSYSLLELLVFLVKLSDQKNWRTFEDSLRGFIAIFNAKFAGLFYRNITYKGVRAGK